MVFNLSKMHGREEICKMKENKRFKEVSFLVLATSSSVPDRDYCMNKADKLFSKPSDSEGLKFLVQTVVELPSKKNYR